MRTPVPELLVDSAGQIVGRSFDGCCPQKLRAIGVRAIISGLGGAELPPSRSRVVKFGAKACGLMRLTWFVQLAWPGSRASGQARSAVLVAFDALGSHLWRVERVARVVLTLSCRVR